MLTSSEKNDSDATDSMLLGRIEDYFIAELAKRIELMGSRVSNCENLALNVAAFSGMLCLFPRPHELFGGYCSHKLSMLNASSKC
jgi:hypothetical protein